MGVLLPGTAMCPAFARLSHQGRFSCPIDVRLLSGNFLLRPSAIHVEMRIWFDFKDAEHQSATLHKGGCTRAANQVAGRG
jgi:hypothetical protein